MRRLVSVRSWPADVVMAAIFFTGVGLVSVAMLVMVIAFAYKVI